MMLSNGYQKGQFIFEHPFGSVYRIFKDEYNIHFEKCLIDGNISLDTFSTLHQLKHYSQIVEYETQKDYIIIENINLLPPFLTSNEIKKLMIDMFYAIDILKQHQLSIAHISLNQIYQSNTHYKLDCYNIGNADYKTLIQDVCQIGLTIIDEKESELYLLLKLFVNKKYQRSISSMIKQLEHVKVINEIYPINTNKKQDFRKNQYITSMLPKYLISYHLVKIVLIILFILIWFVF